jgi:hypothetical protein
MVEPTKLLEDLGVIWVICCGPFVCKFQQEGEARSNRMMGGWGTCRAEREGKAASGR